MCRAAARRADSTAIRTRLNVYSFLCGVTVATSCSPCQMAALTVCGQLADRVLRQHVCPRALQALFMYSICNAGKPYKGQSKTRL